MTSLDDRAALVLDLDSQVAPARPSTVVVVAAAIDLAALSDQWRVGPLPLRQPQNRTTARRGHDRATDGATRRTLVADQQANVLYGGGGFHRLHRIVVDGEILALELLVEEGVVPFGPRLGLIVVHCADVRSGTDRLNEQVDWLAALSLRSAASAPLLSRALASAGPGVVLSTDSRARTASFLSMGIEHTDRPSALAVAYAMVSEADATDWAHTVARAERHGLTVARPDWSALVLRDGAAFVAHQRDDEPFAASLRMQVHSVFTDALLLAIVQRALIDRSGDRAASASLSSSAELTDLEASHFDFRRTVWRTSLTSKRTAPADVVLQALQSELLTAADVGDVEQRVRDGARLAVSINARAQNAAQERLNRMVQNASIVIGSFGLTFTAAPVVTQPSWSLFGVSFVLGIIGVVGALVVLQLTGHRAGTDAIQSPPRIEVAYQRKEKSA